MRKLVKKMIGGKKPKNIFSEDNDQALYKAVVKNNSSTLFAVEMDGTIRLSEGKGLKLIGLKPGQLVGQSVFDLYKDNPEVAKGFKKAFKGERTSYSTKIGEVTFLTILDPIKDRDGKIVGATGTAIDISERVELEKSVAKSELNYRSIFHSVNDALFIHEIDTGKIIDVNDKMCQMYGYSREEALKGDVGMFSTGVSPYDQKNAEKKVRLAASGKPQIFEWHGKTKNGKIFWTEVSLSRVTLDGVDRIIAVVRDIEERKHAEEQMIIVNKTRSEFLSMAAHQLRTPLSSMRWNMELLLRNIEGYNIHKEAVDLIKKNYQSNLSLIDLVGNLLNVSRIEQNRLKSHVRKFSLVDLIEEVIEPLKSESRLKQLSIKLRVNKHHRYSVRMDKTQVREAICNIIENAVKYSYKNTSVNISLNRKDKFFEIKASNEGIGIPISESDRIFEKFYRAENAIKQNSTGTGLGLFIAKSFVERIDGNISFSSSKNKRTIFIIRIPTSITK